MAFIDVLNNLLLVGSLVMLISIMTSVLAFRYGAPLLLVFLGVGLLTSANGIGFIHFSSPSLAFSIGSIAIAFILFEGGLSANLSNYHLAAAPSIMLATLGVVLTTVGVGALAHVLLAMPWGFALLVGAIVSPTDTAAVNLLLRVGGIHIRGRVASTLEIESAVNDPFSIMLTLTLMSGLQHLPDAGSLDLPYLQMAESFLLQAVLGGAFGWAGGRLLTSALNRFEIDSGLYPVLSLTSVLGIFSLTALAGGSGFLAVYIAGMIVGKKRFKNGQSLKRFHNGIAWLAQIVMFVTLGLLAQPRHFLPMLSPAILIAAGLIFIARPVAVWLCLLPFRFTPNEKTFIAWVGLRGAVSILLAILPVLGHESYADAAFAVTFLVVVLSLVVQGWTIKPLARWLGLIIPLEGGPVERVELDLPLESAAATGGYELLAYNVHEASPAGGGGKLPRWARPALVIRAGDVVNPRAARYVQGGDHVYLFAPESRAPLLDRLFARPLYDGGGSADDHASATTAFFGDLAVKPEVPLGELAERYDFPVPFALRDKTAAELFIDEFEGRYDLGDRLRFGGVDLIVRSISRRHITSVGIALPPLLQAGKGAFSIPSPAALLAPLRRGWRRVRHFHLGDEGSRGGPEGQGTQKPQKPGT